MPWYEFEDKPGTMKWVILVVVVLNEFVNETFKLTLWKIIRSLMKFSSWKISLYVKHLRLVECFAYGIAWEQPGIELFDFESTIIN